MRRSPVAEEGPGRLAPTARRRKTFTGCWSCRSRKVKCDEATPDCHSCVRRGVRCGGYGSALVWVVPNQTHDYQVGRRRILKSVKTWEGHAILTAEAVEALIEECEVDVESGVTFTKSAGPFTVFTIKSTSNPIRRSLTSGIDEIFAHFEKPKICETSSLFHHYVTYIALNMMPFMDGRNPWLSYYPAMAMSCRDLGHNSLLHAILAQAAGNLAHLGYMRDDMLALAMKLYDTAVRLLRETLQEKTVEFSYLVATILTLIMAEAYIGKFNAWRVHLNGAWDFLISLQNGLPWQSSEEAWVTAQSLCLFKIRSDTMHHFHSHHYNSRAVNYSILSSLTSRTDFGFTAGACPGLIRCIYRITSFESQSHDTVHYQDSVSDLHEEIHNCNIACSRRNDLVTLHHEIFKTGVVIHFHRRVLNSLPKSLDFLLDTLLQCVEAYRGGYITLWPVFIGAVEAHTEEQMSRFRAWMSEARTIGAKSREDVKELIEAVWQTRNKLAANGDEGELIVDWRIVMAQMRMDVLLV